MSDTRFMQQVNYHLRLLQAPDYTAKGDAVNFFKINHRKAIPILEQMAARNDPHYSPSAHHCAERCAEKYQDKA